MFWAQERSLRPALSIYTVTTPTHTSCVSLSKMPPLVSSRQQPPNQLRVCLLLLARYRRSQSLTCVFVTVSASELEKAHDAILKKNCEEDYDLIDEIGQGQYAVVHRAQKKDGDDKVRAPPPRAARPELTVFSSVGVRHQAHRQESQRDGGDR